jgi:hypothetical protein
MVFLQGSSHIGLRTKVLGSTGGFSIFFAPKHLESTDRRWTWNSHVIKRQCHESFYFRFVFISHFPRSLLIALHFMFCLKISINFYKLSLITGFSNSSDKWGKIENHKFFIHILLGFYGKQYILQD